MLTPDLKTALAGHLQLLATPVELRAALDDSPASRELLALLTQVAALSPRITVTTTTGSGRTPSFGVTTPGQPARVCFAGVPLGHEFTSFVLALLQVAGHAPKAAPALLDQIRAIDQDLEFETTVSLSCQLCPEVVQALNLMAILNPRIRHTMIDGALFPDEVERRQVLAVPSVYLNGASFGQGRLDLKDVLARLTPEAEPAARPTRAPYDVIVIGGGPAGAAAAVYVARKGLRTALVAERLGGQLLDTMGVENFISVTHTEGPALARGLEAHVAAYDIEVLDRQRVARLVPAATDPASAEPGDPASGPGVGVELGHGEVLRARAVILATGARWREIGVPGEAAYRNRGVAYCPHCDGPLYRDKAVAVIGGGNSGVEAAIDLAGIARHVTLVEVAPALRADAVLVAKLHSLANVTVLTQTQTIEVVGDGSRVTGLTIADRESPARRTLPLAGVFVQIGLVPNTDWLQGQVALSARGEIEIDGRGATSMAGVYAAGDCTTVPFKQIVIAAGEGAKAALGAFDYLIRSPGARLGQAA